MSFRGNVSHSRKAVGRAGEDLAVRFLEAAGYSIIERNWRAGREGEMDIIARTPDQATLVFAEVKTRRSQACGLPVEAVDARKCAQMLLVAETYLMRHYPENQPQARFDVLSVYTGGARLQIDHLENVIN